MRQHPTGELVPVGEPAPIIPISHIKDVRDFLFALTGLARPTAVWLILRTFADMLRPCQ